MNLTLELIDERNRDECLALEVEPHQRHLIATNQRSLEQADQNPEAVSMLVRRDGEAVGFLMYEPRGESVVSLHRFMIDRRYQRQGIGRRSMEQLIDRLHTEGYLTIYLSFRPENAAARRLYDQLGFVEHEIEPDGEVFYRLGPPSI